MCGEKDPDATVMGDIDGDGKITEIDKVELKYRFLKGDWRTKEDKRKRTHD